MLSISPELKFFCIWVIIIAYLGCSAGWESNPGLPFSRPARLSLCYAAP